MEFRPYSNFTELFKKLAEEIKIFMKNKVFTTQNHRLKSDVGPPALRYLDISLVTNLLTVFWTFSHFFLQFYLFFSKNYFFSFFLAQFESEQCVTSYLTSWFVPSRRFEIKVNWGHFFLVELIRFENSTKERNKVQELKKNDRNRNRGK